MLLTWKTVGLHDPSSSLAATCAQRTEECQRLAVSCFPAGCADSAAEDGRRGSNVYEVNPWLWQFGRGKPRLGGLTIEETSDRQDAARKASDKRRKETREGRKGS